MILPDVKSGRKEALYLITKCHLELKEPQCALKYTTKSMDNLDERTISIGCDIINSLLLLNNETFGRMRSIQRQYLEKISLINEELGREIGKKSNEIVLNEAKRTLKNEMIEMKNQYLNVLSNKEQNQQLKQNIEWYNDIKTEIGKIDKDDFI